MNENTLLDFIDEYFFELLREDTVHLKNEETYKSLEKSNEDILNKYPRLTDALLGKATKLDDGDVQALLLYLDNIKEMHTFEMKLCYFKGMKDISVLLNKITSLEKKE